MPLPIGAAALTLVVPLVVKVLVSLGVGFVVYTGVDTLVEVAQQEIISQMSTLPASLAQIAGLMGVDTALTIILSAFSIRLTLAGLTAAGMKRIRLN